MRYVALALILAVLFICSEAKPPSARFTRAVSQENCPENSTAKECFEYASNISKMYKSCHRFIIGDSIEWQSCGVVACGEGTVKVPEDINKPYPLCCESCELSE